MKINNLSIKRKFFLLVGSICAIFIVALLFIKSANDEIAGNFNQFYQGNFKVSVAFNGLKEKQNDIMLNVRGLQIAYLLNLNEQLGGYKQNIKQHMADTPDLLNELSEDFSGNKNNLTQLINLVEQFQQRSTQFIQAMEQAPDNKAPFIIFSEFVNSYNALTTYLVEFGKLNANKARQANQAAQAAIEYANIVFYIAIFIALFAAWLFSSLIAKNIIIAVNKVKQAAQAMAKGQLTSQCNIEGKDELAQLGRAIDLSIQHLHKTLLEINESTNVVGQNSQTLLKANANIQQAASEVSGHTIQVVTAIEEFSTTSKSIAVNTSETADTSDEMTSLANRGIESSEHTKEAVINLVNNLNETSAVVNLLRDESTRIESILDVIRNIAEQTNLLALNAAIEAARAGEQGRGFAVVADEVRNLAQRSQSSVREIETMLSQLGGACDNAVNMMNESGTIASSTEQSVTQSNQLLADILAMIHQVNGQTQQIATAAEEQSAVAADISENMHTVQMLSDKTASISESTKAYSEEMQQASEKVQTQVSFFKL
ncbi:methyl-accepting chemotaxis protein [Catenovulum adriaticum]|uniref:Methyl-accepting chemotaxis protein n=1 Tax=Catenovulum adriaticum TaxID=2984846 RepID=A0ABY7AK98_9ALTE|nr:methyl-accepting chemotaxis protein [Catenovulum sp. TS8]WAJ69973.1 methyl-accepting chemotaxis protein [Catenovulum sp. TS8]